MEFEFWNRKWFPIGCMESKRALYVIGDLDPSPVYLWEDIIPNEPVRVYKSLTSMTSVIVKCCQLGVYKLFTSEYRGDPYYEIKTDTEKLELEKAIYEEYNS